jgi:hypothetical protein
VKGEAAESGLDLRGLVGESGVCRLQQTHEPGDLSLITEADMDCRFGDLSRHL